MSDEKYTIYKTRIKRSTKRQLEDLIGLFIISCVLSFIFLAVYFLDRYFNG